MLLPDKRVLDCTLSVDEAVVTCQRNKQTKTLAEAETMAQIVYIFSGHASLQMLQRQARSVGHIPVMLGIGGGG